MGTMSLVDGFKPQRRFPMPETTEVLPLAMDSIEALLRHVGYDRFERNDEDERFLFDVQGESTRLRVQIGLGRTPAPGTTNDQPWFVRLVSFSLQFEPAKAGVDQADVFAWINAKNKDILFGRYYYEVDSDTIAFELSLPCNGGIHPENLLDMLHMATVAVDQTHEGLEQKLGAPAAKPALKLAPKPAKTAAERAPKKATKPTPKKS